MASSSKAALPAPPSFSWEEMRGIQLAPFILYRGHFERHDIIRTRSPFYTWWWLEEGHIRIETLGKTLHVRPKQWIFLPIHVERLQAFEPGSKFISVNFKASWENGLPLLSLPEPIIQGAEERNLISLAEALCLTVESGHGPGFCALRNRKLELPSYFKSRATMALFAEELFRIALQHGGEIIPPATSDVRLELVLTDLRDNGKAGPLPFKAWEKKTGLGRSQLDRLARRVIGMSLHRYRDSQLTSEARRRLTSNALVKQVAEELGFVDTAHFCRWVRRQTGHSPQELKTLQI